MQLDGWMKHYNIRIYGRVQGVNFRWFVLRKARSSKLNGFVKNEPDGSIYIEAEGDEGSLAKFLDACRKGPIFARVDKLEFEENIRAGYNTFEIKR